MIKKDGFSPATSNTNDPFALTVTSIRELTAEDTNRVGGGGAATSAECTGTCNSTYTCTKPD